MPEQAHFARAMADALVSEFAQIETPRVVSRRSGEYCMEEHLALSECARLLDVEGLIEGSVFRSRDHVRIVLSLIDARTEQTVLTRIYERDLRDVLSLFGEVAQDVAEAVHAKLAPGEQARLQVTRQVDPRAYDAYVRAFEIAIEGSHDVFRSGSAEVVAALTRAVELDPGFAEAWALRGWMRAFQGVVRSRELMQLGREDARRALELDDRLAIAHATLCYVRAWRDWDFESAQTACARGVELGPNEPVSVGTYAAFLLEVEGRTREAIELSARLLVLRPLDEQAHAHMGFVLHLARHYERALDHLRRVRELNRDAYLADEANVYELLGRYEQAHRSYLAVYERCGSPCDWERDAAGRGWNEDGFGGRLRFWAEAAAEHSSSIPIVAYALGMLGEADEAFAWLERGYRERDPLMVNVRSSPWIDPLRPDPRYRDLLRRIGFPDVDTDPGAQAATGRVMALSGRAAGGIAELQEAIAAGPMDSRRARWHYYLALAYFAQGEYERAVDWAERVFEHKPREYTTADAHLVLAASRGHLGQRPQARASLDEALRLWPTLTEEMVPLPPYTDPDFRQRYVEGLRFAGLEASGDRVAPLEPPS